MGRSGDRLRGDAREARRRADHGAHVEDDTWIDVVVGSGCQLHVSAKPAEGDRLLDDLAEIVEAVLAGRYREEIWWAGGHQTKIVATIDLPTGPLRWPHWQLGWLISVLRRKQRTTRQWQPYERKEEDGRAQP